ncbi:xanthine dehydrogenase family protein molybdopterin-binding subunit [Modestobacter muralis]|uniref:Xanthine dehydrogenase family protein molybdopterin-binding subunit n=1 Tax=Modestobacter muralis TaxID=1608614 RepID=A0A6P0F2D2_9ACTN|nr:xanthine dehydrogenase family protein molybdopterin-binding subunit [Modestobacter muralis]NEK95508.1 xanthine dehydrogenase family protein molybdopterin-binding subunit [Modestobacter muralis]NEN52396.1 xanthine dehydrogenase family protein molybdopterin-binding subunit [Modestobacter muralis]
MTDLLTPRAIGQSLVRRDGVDKVRGTATYAFETDVEHPAYCHPVQATIALGRVTAMDTAAAEALDGVLAVLTPFNAERLASTEDAEYAVLQSTEVAFRGQLIGLVVAETSELAREVADGITVTYAEQPHDSELRTDHPGLYAPEQVNAGHPTDTAEGDVDAAMAAAEVTVDHTYETQMLHNNPIEPHATTALWEDGSLTLWDSTQGVHPDRAAVCEVFGLDEERVRVVCPYVGGGFGSKGNPHANVMLVTMAARALPGRPVKLALTRQQMFFLTGYRTPTIQRMQLGADRRGRLSAIAIDVVEQTSKIKEFAEQTGVPARMMYASPNRRTTHRLAPLDVPIPSWMRAPGECPGMFGPEVAMDELAEALGMDPVQLRIANEPDVDPDTGKPWSSRHLVECLREGAQRFGWDSRGPGRRREGDWLVGHGMASSVYPTMRQATSTASIRFSGGRYVAEIGAADLGTGAWTVLPQIAADALGVDVADVDVAIGDTRYPTASVAGGSSGTNTWGSAIVQAAREFRGKYGTDPQDGDEASGDVDQAAMDDAHAAYAFGAQFAEARVNADTGEIRVPRLIGVFAAGRIINPRTARSQLIGGMTMGLSMALHEDSVFDTRIGQVANHDLADYHITVNADVGEIEAHWLDEHDPYVNVMGAKGIGEIGITGTAAAVVNAVHHATGVRVRSLPVTLDKVLAGLD